MVAERPVGQRNTMNNARVCVASRHAEATDERFGVNTRPIELERAE